MKRTVCAVLAAVFTACCIPTAFAAEDADASVFQKALSERMGQMELADLPPEPEKLPENQRQVLDFNTDWLFIAGDDLNAKAQDYDESAAEAVSLPHAREAYDLYRPDIDALQTIDWYRRHFTLPQEDAGDRVFVEFNGGGQINRVYVNGALVGEAKGTFTHFRFEITDYVTFGEYDNVIAVQVDSRYHKGEMPPGNNIDFHYFGGLHGQAALTLADPLYAESVFYYNDEVVNGCSSATLNGWIDLSNGYLGEQQAIVRSVVEDAAGNEVSVMEQPAAAPGMATTQVKLAHAIDQPHLWSPNDPYLYTVKTEILVEGVSLDQVATTIGLRTLQATSTADTEGYFILNGERIQVIGGNRHMQAPYLGNSVTPKLNAKDAETLKHDLGINFVRTSHYETDPAFLEACDRLSIMVEEEPLGWQDTPGWEQFCYSAEEMVKRDRNHPCIVMWSIIPNERGTDAPTLAASRERQQTTKALDPSRLTIQEEMNQSTVVADVYGWHDYTNPNAGNPFSVPRNAKSWFVTEWNTNLGKHFIIPNDSEARKIAQVEQDGLKLSQLSNNKRIMGTLKWDLFGYMTPMSKDERGKNVNLWRCSGVYGHWRDPLHKTWIAYLMAAQAPNQADVGDILFINSEWKETSPKSLTVSTNLDTVELYYGRGEKEPELVGSLSAPNELTTLQNGLFRFDLGGREWAADSYLLAKGYKAGQTLPAKEHTVYASTYESEKEGAALTLHNTIGDIEADGADVAWLLAELTDKNGQREFYGDDNMTVEILSGPGRLWYAGDAPVMADGLSGFYLKSEQDKPGATTVKASVDLGDTLDDTAPEIQYSTGWTEITNRADAYGGSLHEAGAGETATITFTGTQLAIYSESRSGGGSASVMLDGAPAGSLSCSNADKYGTIANQQVWKTPKLENGTHTVTITAKGAVNLDRLKVFDGVADASGTITVTTLADPAKRVRSNPGLPDAEAPDEDPGEALKLLLAEAKTIDRSQYSATGLALLDDAIEFAESAGQLQDPAPSILSKALNQLRQAMAALEKLAVYTIPHTRTTMEGQSGGVAYIAKAADTWVAGGKNTYAKMGRSPEDYYSITFEGVKIELYSQMDGAHGIAAISVDGGQEVEVDQYHAVQVVDTLFWQSEVLEPGTHTVKVRVTGKTSGNPANACVSFGFAKVYERIDLLQQAKTSLAQALATADVLDCTKYTPASLDVLDQAIAQAEAILRSADATLDQTQAVTGELEDALIALVAQGTQETLTLTCGEEDRTTVQGTENKIFYFSKAPGSDWVLENADNEALRNRYLKKIVTNQSPTPYAELVFTGSGVELFARYSKTSGLAWVEIRDEKGELVREQRNIDLYDETVGNAVPGTRSIYAVSGLEPGTYTLRLYPENKAHNPGTDLTSINFAHALVTTGESRPTLETEVLQAAVEKLNAASLEGRHPQVAAAFQTEVIRLVKNSYGLLAGSWPQVELADPLPLGATPTRVARVAQDAENALALLEVPLTVASVKPVANVNVAFGTLLADLPLPLMVTVVSSDAQPEKLGVSWACENYDPEAPGGYIFKGELALPQGMTNPLMITAEVTVVVAESGQTFYPINAVTEGGQAELAVPAQAAEGEEVSVKITSIADGFAFDGIRAVYQPIAENDLHEAPLPEPSSAPEPPDEQEAPPEGQVDEGVPPTDPPAPDSQQDEPELGEPLPEAQKAAPQPPREPAAEGPAELAPMSFVEAPVPADQMRETPAPVPLELVEAIPGQEYRFAMPAGEVQITVSLKAQLPVAVSEVVIQGGANSLTVGQEMVLKALVKPADADYEGIEWKADGDAVEAANRNEELVVTASKPGKATSTAVAGGVSSAPLTVQVDPAPTAAPQPTPKPEENHDAGPAPTQTPAAPQQARRPRATEKPEPTQSPAATAAPEPTQAPAATPEGSASEPQAEGEVAQAPGPKKGVTWPLVALGVLGATALAAGVALFLRGPGRKK